MKAYDVFFDAYCKIRSFFIAVRVPLGQPKNEDFMESVVAEELRNLPMPNQLSEESRGEEKLMTWF